MSDLEKKHEELTATPNGDYQARAADLSGITHNYMASLAKELGSALDAHVRTMNQDTLEEKKTVCKWVNAELRRFDLALKCPKSGLPATLVAEPGHQPEIGRYAYVAKTPDGEIRRRFKRVELSDLELMEAPTRREGLLEWRERENAKQTKSVKNRCL